MSLGFFFFLLLPPMDSAAARSVGGHLSFKPAPPSSSSSDAKTTIPQSMKLSRGYALDAYSRHKQFVNDYVRFYGRKDSNEQQQQQQQQRYTIYMKHSSFSFSSLLIINSIKTDLDLVRQEHRFLRTAQDDAQLNYEKLLAKKYYDKLFKEYAIADLRLYKEGKVGLRWRIEQEVLSGKGQFICGARGCDVAVKLESFEVGGYLYFFFLFSCF